METLKSFVDAEVGETNDYFGRLFNLFRVSNPDWERLAHVPLSDESLRWFLSQVVNTVPQLSEVMSDEDRVSALTELKDSVSLLCVIAEEYGVASVCEEDLQDLFDKLEVFVEGEGRVVPLEQGLKILGLPRLERNSFE